MVWQREYSPESIRFNWLRVVPAIIFIFTLFSGGALWLISGGRGIDLKILALAVVIQCIIPLYYFYPIKLDDE